MKVTGLGKKAKWWEKINLDNGKGKMEISDTILSIVDCCLIFDLAIKPRLVEIIELGEIPTLV